jgi:ferredoxin-NADP reductase
MFFGTQPTRLAPRPSSALRPWLARAAAALATPLVPGDYLSLVDPLAATTVLRARIVDVRREAAGAVSLTLQPGAAWAGHRAGQWISISVEIDGVLHQRSYSLTGPVRPDGLISITVKPIAGGFVSRHVAATAAVGQVLRISQAQGAFVLPAPQPERLLFVTAGSGITPVMGMLRELAGAGELPDAVLLHSALTADEVIFAEELRDLAARHPRFRLVELHTDVHGLLTTDQLPVLVPDWQDRAAYACGPAGLLDALEAFFAGTDLLTVERFAPPVLAATDGAGGTVRFDAAGTTVDADGSTPLLEVGEAAGVLMPSGCRMGICFGCVTPLKSGQVRDLRTGTVHGEPGDLVQTCVSAAAGDVCLDR